MSNALVLRFTAHGSAGVVPPQVSSTVQAEDNSFQPILPEDDIAQMYHRILDTEIAVITGDKPHGKHAGTGSSGQNLKLAAAMGLSQLMLPFRCPLVNPLCCVS